MTARFTDHILEPGLLSARPAASSVPVGALYPATDSGIIYRSDGTTWTTWRPAAEALPLGGATGDVLTKQSATDGDVDWAPPAAGGGGGAGYRFDDPSDPAWGTDLGYDLEFETDDATGTLPSGWAWVNQGTSTYRQKWGAAIVTPQPGTGGDDGHRLLVRSLPTEASWVLTAKVTSNRMVPYNYNRVGLALRESSSGKYVSFASTSDGGTNHFDVVRWNAIASYGGHYANVGTNHEVSTPFYQRLTRVSGTTYKYEVSEDGVTWATILAATDLSGFPITPDQVGLFVNRTSTAADETVAAYHWLRVR